MRPYLAVLAARFRALLQYRAAALAGFGTQLFWGFVRIMIFDAFYSSNAGSQPMELDSVVSYVWLGQAFLTVVLAWRVDSDIQELIRTGDVAHELLRPVDTQGLWLARALAWRTATPVLRAIPMFAFAIVLLPLIGLGEWALRLPPSFAAAFAFGATMVVAVAMSTAITTLMNTSLIWTLAGAGVQMIMPSLTWVLSGMIVPLPLLPIGIQRVLMLLPFAYMVDVPFRLYTGHLDARLLPGLLAVGVGWTVLLLLAGRFLMARARHRLVVQGG